MTTKELAKREEQLTPALPPAVPRVSPETIQDTMQSIALLQGMVRDTLIRGVDYGRIPGTPQDSLWDPGASQIIGSFNCYPGERRILKLEDTDEKIVAVVEVPITSRATQQEVGSGIGAASTLETKYKYRWVSNPAQWGYNDEAIKMFKTKRGKDDEGNDAILYRIPNPEHSELLNTIVKMAAKRAEVDAAESLPGVASVLRQMFSPKKGREQPQPRKGETAKEDYEGPRWQRYWGEVARLGYTQQESYQKLGVAKMHDWLASGRSLEEALAILRGKKEEPGIEDETGTVAPATAAEEEPTGATAPADEEGVVINLEWLKESQQTLKWTNETMLSFISAQYKVSGKTITEALSKLTKEQAADFTRRINDKLEKQSSLF